VKDDTPKEPKEHRHKDRTAGEKREKKEKKKKHRNKEGEGSNGASGAATAELFSEPAEPFSEPPTDPFADQFDVLAGGSASAHYQSQVTRNKAESVDFLSGSFGGGNNAAWTQDFVVTPAQSQAPAPEQPKPQPKKPDDDIWGMVMGSLDNIVATKEPEKRHIQTNGAMNQRAPPSSTTTSTPAANPYAGFQQAPGPYGAPGAFGAYPAPYPAYGQPQQYPYGQPMVQPLVQPFGPSYGQPQAQQPAAANNAFAGLAWN